MVGLSRQTLIAACVAVGIALRLISGLFTPTVGAAAPHLASPRASGAFALPAAITAGASVPGASVTVHWLGQAGDSNWHNPRNWSGEAVPGPDAAVLIEDPSATVVHSAGATSIHSLDSRGQLALSGGSLTLADSSRIDTSLTIRGGSLRVAGGTLTLTGQGSVEGGLDPGTGAPIGGIDVASGATVALNDSATQYIFGTTALTGDGALRVDGASLVLDADLQIHDLALVDGAIDGQGSLTVGRAFTWTGGTLADSRGVGASLTVSSGASLTVAGDAPKALIRRTLTNAGAATWDGSGTLTVSEGALLYNYIGATFDLLRDQTLLHGSGAEPSFHNAGALFASANSNGRTLTFQGRFTQTSDGSLRVTLGGSAGCSAWNTLHVTGQMMLAGVLRVGVADGCTPGLGQSFEVLRFGARSGDFQQVEATGVAVALSYETDRLLLVSTSGGPTPTPTQTASPMPTQTLTVTPTTSPAPTLLPTPPTPTATTPPATTPSPTPPTTPTLTPSTTATASPSATATATPTAFPTPSPTPTFTQTATPTATPSLTATATDTPMPTSTPTEPPAPTATATQSPTPSSTPTRTNSPTASATVAPSLTETPLPTLTATLSPTSTPTSTADPTATLPPAATASPTATATASATPSASAAPSNTPTASPTPSQLPAPPPTTTPTTSPTPTPFVTPLPNRPPVLAVPDSPQTVVVGDLLTFEVQASDPDGTIPTLGALALPSGAHFDDHRDGTGTFAWRPAPDQQATYTITFTAQDTGTLVTGVVRVIVLPAPTPTLTPSATSTATPSPTATVMPSATHTPSATATTPTVTPTPLPPNPTEATPAPQATATRQPTATPEPEENEPTPTPVPPGSGGSAGGSGGSGGSGSPSEGSGGGALPPAPAPAGFGAPPSASAGATFAAPAGTSEDGAQPSGTAQAPASPPSLDGPGLLPPTGGTLELPELGVSLTVPAEATGGRAIRVAIRPVDAGVDAGPPPAGFQLGETVLQVTLIDAAEGTALRAFAVPLTLTLPVGAADLARADSDPTRVRVAFWDGATWVAVPCSVAAPPRTLSCVVAHLTVFGVLVVLPQADGPVELPLPNGRFYRQANGFGGAGERGFSVIDDAQASFWRELQRHGGVGRVGYPISHRFVHQGFLTQAFQKLALQWRPELDQAVPVNVFDDLAARGADNWLDAFRQVPPAEDTAADAGLLWSRVVARHVALLDPYPELRAFYLADPQWLDTYGLPLATRDYGPFVAARLQRATLQLWKEDAPWAAAGTVVVGNGADLAKEVGLWPAAALAPGLPPEPPAPSVPASAPPAVPPEPW